MPSAEASSDSFSNSIGKVKVRRRTLDERRESHLGFSAVSSSSQDLPLPKNIEQTQSHQTLAQFLGYSTDEDEDEEKDNDQATRKVHRPLSSGEGSQKVAEIVTLHQNDNMTRKDPKLTTPPRITITTPRSKHGSQRNGDQLGLSTKNSRPRQISLTHSKAGQNSGSSRGTEDSSSMVRKLEGSRLDARGAEVKNVAIQGRTSSRSLASPRIQRPKMKAGFVLDSDDSSDCEQQNERKRDNKRGNMRVKEDIRGSVTIPSWKQPDLGQPITSSAPRAVPPKQVNKSRLNTLLKQIKSRDSHHQRSPQTTLLKSVTASSLPSGLRGDNELSRTTAQYLTQPDATHDARRRGHGHGILGIALQSGNSTSAHRSNRALNSKARTPVISPPPKEPATSFPHMINSRMSPRSVNKAPKEGRAAHSLSASAPKLPSTEKHIVNQLPIIVQGAKNSPPQAPELRKVAATFAGDRVSTTLSREPSSKRKLEKIAGGPDGNAAPPKKTYRGQSTLLSSGISQQGNVQNDTAPGRTSNAARSRIVTTQSLVPADGLRSNTAHSVSPRPSLQPKDSVGQPAAAAKDTISKAKNIEQASTVNANQETLRSVAVNSLSQIAVPKAASSTSNNPRCASLQNATDSVTTVKNVVTKRPMVKCTTTVESGLQQISRDTLQSSQLSSQKSSQCAVSGLSTSIYQLSSGKIIDSPTTTETISPVPPYSSPLADVPRKVPETETVPIHDAANLVVKQAVASVNPCLAAEGRMTVSDLNTRTQPQDEIRQVNEVLTGTAQKPLQLAQVLDKALPIHGLTEAKDQDVDIDSISHLVPESNDNGDAIDLSTLSNVCSEAEPYFEYSVFQKSWSDDVDEENATTTELLLRPSTDLDDINAQATRFSKSTHEMHAQLSSHVMQQETTKRDEHGCLHFLTVVAPFENTSQKSYNKIWVQRHYVSKFANRTYRDLRRTPVVSSIAYILRLDKLVAAPDSSNSSDSSDSSESEDEDGDCNPIRIRHAISRSELYTTLQGANRAARDVQIELSHEKKPKSDITAKWQEKNLKELNDKVHELHPSPNNDMSFWKSKFNACGMGGDQFELAVEQITLCGPRNL